MAEAPRSQVAAFFDDQTVFITGITGFLGKVLLCKLMMVAPNVRKVYLLIRGRRGKTAQVRFERDVLTTELFEGMLKANPAMKEKFVVCDGDISKPKLGLSTEATAAIENETTIILHCAATTRFTEPLKQALELNTLGAQRMLELAKRCPKLISYIHVSTAYVNCIRGPTQEIREKIYPLPFNPFDMIERIQNMSTEQADLDTDKIIAPWPNTYTFTKSMTEHVLLAERGNLPLAIVRPSIVGCGWVEPVPGWVDSAIGASGLILAHGVGALRAMRGADWHVADIIPVDIVSSGILCSAWRTYVQYKEAAAEPAAVVMDKKGNKVEQSRRPPLPVYHYTSSVKNPVTWGWIRDITGGFFDRHPPKKRVGRPSTRFIPNAVGHAVANAALHFGPAAILDAQRVITGKKARMLKATYILHKAIKSIGFFPNNQWFYANDNVDLLIDEMNEEDKKLFRIDVRELNWELYLIIYSEGLRKYLLKEGPMSDDDIGPRLRLRISGDDIGTGIGPGPMKSRL